MDFFHEDIDVNFTNGLESNSMISKNDNFFVVDNVIKKEKSIWYPVYKELVSRLDRFDISKKKMQFPEIYWGDEKEANIEEMKKRYLFLAENSLFILAPLLREESDEHYNIRAIIEKQKGSFDGKRHISLMNDIYLSVLIEKLLFSDTKLEDSEIYQKVSDYKKNYYYGEELKKGLKLLEKGCIEGDISNVDDAMFIILKRIRGYIEGQVDSLNKQRKLCILDEYFRILRYSNDGKKWTSGYQLDENDRKVNLDSMSEERFSNHLIPVIMVLNRGEGYSRFINSFKVRKDWHSKTYSCLGMSEEDKQDIYLKLHDELPWNLEVKCEMEEPELNSMIDSRLVRPNNTSPCDLSFRIKEGDIFVYGKSFYHLCGNCGFIVKVDNSLLSEGIKVRIRERCNKDKNLFRKMELISELQALDDKSLPHHKVLFKSKDENRKKDNSTFGTTTVMR
ncbi:MAG: hypothetical protein IJN90_06780 [Bacilli bacterium]|nr:hypothetical protein [Bacilli bacterium]